MEHSFPNEGKHDEEKTKSLSCPQDERANSTGPMKHSPGNGRSVTSFVAIQE
jgi:hypothetical protein